MRNSGLIALLAASATLAGCASGPGAFARRAGPDEFAVSRQAPLTVPPDFQLVPPRPGAPRPMEADSSTQALTAMFGGPAARSASERGLLDRAGAARAEAGLRSSVGDPQTEVVDKGPTTRTIIAAPVGQGAEASVTTPQ